MILPIMIVSIALKLLTCKYPRVAEILVLVNYAYLRIWGPQILDSTL